MRSKDVDGYNLFNHIEDKELQRHNRSMVIANICEDNLRKDTGTISDKGALLAIKYFKEVQRDIARADKISKAEFNEKCQDLLSVAKLEMSKRGML